MLSFFACLLVGLARKDVGISNWIVLLIYLGIVVSIDLTVFQTPIVTKFANTEFENTDLAEQMSEAILKSKKEFDMTKGKSELLLKIVQESEDYFSDKGTISNWKHYKFIIKDYLNEYLEHFDIHVNVQQFVRTTSDSDTIRNIKDICIKILNSNGIIDMSNLTDITDLLFRGDVYKVAECVYILPIYGKNYSMLVTITGEEILPIDVVNITYMINFCEWFLV